MSRRTQKPLARVATTRQVWKNFNLWRGHVFGEDTKGPYVTGVQPTSSRTGIIVYRAEWTEERYKWRKVIEPANTETGRAILAAALLRPCVDFGSIEEQVARIYHPKLTSGVVYR